MTCCHSCVRSWPVASRSKLTMDMEVIERRKSLLVVNRVSPEFSGLSSDPPDEERTPREAAVVVLEPGAVRTLVDSGGRPPPVRWRLSILDMFRRTRWRPADHLLHLSYLRTANFVSPRDAGMSAEFGRLCRSRDRHFRGRFLHTTAPRQHFTSTSSHTLYVGRDAVSQMVT